MAAAIEADPAVRRLPLRALSIVAHPNTGHSLSHAMDAAARAVLARRGYEIAHHDLYVEDFAPVHRTGEGGIASSDALVEQHCAELAVADVIVIAHPNWWGQPPAILKGWVDRVFRLDTAYTYPDGTGFGAASVGLLRAKCAFVFNTTNTEAQREMEVFGDPLQRLWRDCVFGFCGIGNVVRRMYGPIAGSTPEERARWLAEIAALVEEHA